MSQFRKGDKTFRHVTLVARRPHRHQMGPPTPARLAGAAAMSAATTGQQRDETADRHRKQLPLTGSAARDDSPRARCG